MAKSNYWYLLVLSSDGPAFVTSVDNKTKTCRFEKDKKPIELSKDYARDIAVGLMWDFKVAYPVCLHYELESQPFDYSRGRFAWQWSEEEQNA